MLLLMLSLVLHKALQFADAIHELTDHRHRDCPTALVKVLCHVAAADVLLVAVFTWHWLHLAGEPLVRLQRLLLHALPASAVNHGLAAIKLVRTDLMAESNMTTAFVFTDKVGPLTMVAHMVLQRLPLHIHATAKRAGNLKLFDGLSEKPCLLDVLEVLVARPIRHCRAAHRACLVILKGFVEALLVKDVPTRLCHDTSKGGIHTDRAVKPIIMWLCGADVDAFQCRISLATGTNDSAIDLTIGKSIELIENPRTLR